METSNRLAQFLKKIPRVALRETWGGSVPVQEMAQMGDFPVLAGTAALKWHWKWTVVSNVSWIQTGFVVGWLIPIIEVPSSFLEQNRPQHLLGTQGRVTSGWPYMGTDSGCLLKNVTAHKSRCLRHGEWARAEIDSRQSRFCKAKQGEQVARINPQNSMPDSFGKSFYKQNFMERAGGCWLFLLSWWGNRWCFRLLGSVWDCHPPFKLVALFLWKNSKDFVMSILWEEPGPLSCPIVSSIASSFFSLLPSLISNCLDLLLELRKVKRLNEVYFLQIRDRDEKLLCPGGYQCLLSSVENNLQNKNSYSLRQSCS